VELSQSMQSGRDRPSRALRTKVVLFGALLTVTACDSNPMGPVPTAATPEPCLQALFGAAIAHVPLPSDLASAVEHAAGPMAEAVGAPTLSAELADLRRGFLSSKPSSSPVMNDCGAVNRAAAALVQVPDTPKTRPDREGIRLVLMLVARTFQADSGQ